MIITASQPAAQARHVEIAITYAAHERDQRRRRTNPVTRMAWLRLAEMERLYAHRYGRTLPDDDAGREDLELLLHHIAGARIDVEHRSRRRAKTWAPWLSAGEVAALIERVAASPMRFKAATLGRRLGLTEAERTRLKIQTIWPIDATETQAERRRRQDRERTARKRAEARAERPKPISRSKPWEAEGVSRRTWYRRRAKAGGTKPVRSISVAYTADAFSATARGGRGWSSKEESVSSVAVVPQAGSSPWERDVLDDERCLSGGVLPQRGMGVVAGGVGQRFVRGTAPVTAA